MLSMHRPATVVTAERAEAELPGSQLVIGLAHNCGKPLMCQC